MNCKETVRPPLQDHYTCKQCRVTFCHKHLYQNNHQCKSIPPAPDKNAGKQAVARLRANWKNILGTPVSSKQSTGSAANPIALDGDSGKKRTSLFSKSTAIPGPKPIKAEANEVVIVRQGLKGNDKLPANKRCTIAVQAKVEEVGKEGGSENTSGQDANADAGKEAKKVVKVYRMRAFFNEDWVIGRVMDEALRLLGLENLNASEVPQEQKWGVMIEDGNRGELIDAGKILKQVKSAHPGKTLTIRKGYMLDREQMMAL